jgi:hypothetical protein
VRRDYQGGSHKEAVVKTAHSVKMLVKGGRKEKHVSVHKRLDDGRVSRRSGATPELLPLGKVMRARSSRNRCKSASP